MGNIDAGLFLDDFEAEAKTHIEKIESAFLDTGSLAGNDELMNGVFRAAHSLKGTAGFFSLKQIVAVAHELESLLSRIKDGDIQINDEIVDLVLESVDRLKELIDNVHSEEEIDNTQLLDMLKKYSDVPKSEVKDNICVIDESQIPFDFSDGETLKKMQEAARFGNKFYFVNIHFNRKLGKLYKHPENLLEGITSVGVIAEAMIKGQGEDDKSAAIIKEQDSALMAESIIGALSKHDTSVLNLLVISILDYDLFSIAIEIDIDHIHAIKKEVATGQESKEEPKPNVEQDRKKADRSSPEQAGNFSIRLDISVINGLLDLANEMILTRNQLVSAVEADSKALPGIVPVIHDLSRLTSEIQEKVMYTRMQPISVIFNKFPRIIHDTAKSLEKDIEVVIVRDDVMLDKYLLEALTDPITQLVKNSADHGLEKPEGRSAAGKPKKGKIILNAFMRDGSAIIEVTDDGAGINTDRLIQKAAEMGIATEEELAARTKNEIFELMFEPGFSTAKTVTNLSGRGVGMDIVKNNIQKLGGVIETESEIGSGTTMRLKMPLTLSVTSSLIVSIDSINYAVPDMNVERIVRICKDSDAKCIERVNKSLILRLNKRLIPVVTMGDIAAKAKGLKPASASETLENCKRSGTVKCLVLRAEGKSFALLIDDALETEQVLVKSLPIYLQNCPCFSNVTVLGNGNAVTIIDAEGIMRYMGIDEIQEEADKHLSQPEDDCEAPEKDKKQVIVFSCSGTEFYAIETSEISRIEGIAQDDIQEIGRGRFVNVTGETLRVVRPEDFAPVRKRAYSEEKLYVLKLKNCASPIGLLAKNVLDKIEDSFVFEDGHILSEYIFGTSVFKEKILIFLDPKAIKEDIENDKVSKMVRRKEEAS